MLSENKTTEHPRSSSGKIEIAASRNTHRGHFVSMMFLTLSLALGAMGLLLFASMENNRTSLSKIDELERNNVELAQDTIPIPQPQEIVEQLQDNMVSNNNIDTQLPIDITEDQATLNLGSEISPDEFID